MNLKNQKIIKLDAGFVSYASAVGRKEHEGPLRNRFDVFDVTDEYGQKKWDRSESVMERTAVDIALKKAGMTTDEIDAIFAGDLQNQCTSSAYGAKDYDIPYLGLYGACSTSAESIMLASIMLKMDNINACIAVTSSHNCSAEMQFRTPLEYGAQRTPTAQWTVTGAGAFILTSGNRAPENAPSVCEAMPGRIVEMGINDTNNMGAAMAPAAADTLMRYLSVSDSPNPDLILTGDLGYEGSSILCELMDTQGINIRSIHNDCGMIIYSRNTQDTHAGGSGCGCSATVLAAYILPKLAKGELNDVIFMATGAMMSPSSIKQGEAIPAIAHLLRIRSAEFKGRSR